MVKVGFICEGDIELIIVKSDLFKLFLTTIQLELVMTVNAAGSGNLLPKTSLLTLEFFQTAVLKKYLF